MLASLVLVIGCVLPWWTRGGADGLPAVSGNAFDSSGIVVFIVALAIVAVVTLPYAAGDRPVGIDRWPTYLLLAVAGWLGLVVRVADLGLQGALIFREPAEVVTRGPGLVLVVLGLALLSEAVFEMARDRER